MSARFLYNNNEGQGTVGLQRLQHFSNRGFTIIELVVVVLILSVLAGAVVAAFGPDFVEDQQTTATRYEMSQIRDAILKFKRDNPSHDLVDANLCSPADISFLLVDGFDTDNICDDTPEGTLSSWDLDYRIGWNGPYITKISSLTADSAADIEHDGTIDNEPALPDVPVLTDPYDNPYYYFELENSDTGRIVSFGPNGIYENNATSPGCPDESSVLGDDLIVCLR